MLTSNSLSAAARFELSVCKLVQLAGLELSPVLTPVNVLR